MYYIYTTWHELQLVHKLDMVVLPSTFAQHRSGAPAVGSRCLTGESWSSRNVRTQKSEIKTEKFWYSKHHVCLNKNGNRFWEILYEDVVWGFIQHPFVQTLHSEKKKLVLWRSEGNWSSKRSLKYSPAKASPRDVDVLVLSSSRNSKGNLGENLHFFHICNS